MSENGTAVALMDAPTDQEIENIRKRGAAVVAHRRELVKLEKQIAGLSWGSGSMAVRGSSMSPMTRAVVAEFCALTRANPLYHIYILGDRPYLNAEYWSDRLNTEPRFIRYEQRDLSPSVEQALRARAARHKEVAEALKAFDPATATQRLAKSIELEDEADDLALARAQWSPPAWAQCVIQTTIYRFIEAAPIDAIRRGEILGADLDRFIVPVHECNWAGGKPRQKASSGKEYDPDPVGNGDPAKTARTRSLRRCGVKAFSAWMAAYEDQIRKAEEALEAEFEVVRSSPRQNGQALQVGAGEPQPADEAIEVEALPVEEVQTEAVPYTEDRFVSDETAPSPSFDEAEARRGYFATLRDAGIEDRAAWQAQNGLPASTKEFGPEGYGRAMGLLLDPVRVKAKEGARLLGMDVAAVALEAHGKDFSALTYRELQGMVGRFNSMLDTD